MRRLTRKPIVGLALTLAISCSLITGCGSSSKGSTTQNATTTSPPATTASTTQTTTHKIGEAAAVGTLQVKPTSFLPVGTTSGAAGPELHYRLAVSLKNEGTQPAMPFCAGEHASLTDTKGRVFEGEDLKPQESGSVNCVPLSAGQSGSPYLVDFHVPADTVPKTVSIWAEDAYKGQAQSWSAH